MVYADSRNFTEDLTSAIENNDGLCFFFLDYSYPRANHDQPIFTHCQWSIINSDSLEGLVTN